MWLSEIVRRTDRSCESTAEIGIVSIGGRSSAANLSGERRSLEILRPANIFRIPKPEEEQLVLTCGDGSRVIAGVLGGDAPDNLEAGDIYIKTDNSLIVLKNDGDLVMVGNVKISGTLTVNGRQI